MEHSYETHVDRINKLCRLCGSRSFNPKKPNQKRRYCKNYEVQILKLCRINVCNDIPGQHAETICQKCYASIVNFSKKTQVPAIDKAINDAVKKAESSRHLWTSFKAGSTESECPSCQHFLTQRTGFIF